MSDRIGQRIDRYVIEAELGRGGFGAVYRARHTMLGRRVALKVLHAQRALDREVLERFLREARGVAAIGSANIVAVLDAGIAETGEAFLAMELLEGEELAARIARGPVPVAIAIDLTRQILRGLAAAHASDVVHRDLKPSNVFVARTPEGDVAKILDFGISKMRPGTMGEALTRTDAVMGTPHYMAPEQLHGARDVDARADLYSASVVLYEMVSGRLPYEATTLEGLLAARLVDDPIPIRDRAPWLAQRVIEVIDRGLARDPSRRFASAAEMDAALASAAALVSGSMPTVRSVPPAHTTIPSTTPVALARPASGATPWLLVGAGSVIALLLGLVALLAIALAAVAYWSTSRAPAEPAAPVVVAQPPTPPPEAPPIVVVPMPYPRDAPPPPLPPPPSPETSAGSRDTSVSSDGALRVVRVSLIGNADGMAIDRLVERARGRLESCRGPVAADVVVQLMISRNGTIPIAQPDPNGPHGDDTVAACVATVLRDHAPLDGASSSTHGIARLRAHVPAR